MITPSISVTVYCLVIELKCFSVVLRVMYLGPILEPVEKLANLNASWYAHGTRQSGTLNVQSSRSMRSCASISSPLLNSEEYAEDTDAAARQCLDELPRRIAVEREQAFG